MYRIENNDSKTVVNIGARSTKPTSLPLTPVEYAHNLKFNKPAEKSYPIGASVFSIASLVIMTVFSAFMLFYLLDYQPLNLISSVLGVTSPGGALASWVWLPFLFTVFGAGLGASFELYLLLTGTPFAQTRSKATSFVRDIRLLNLSPVALTIFFAVVCMTVTDASLRLSLLYLSGFVGFGLAFALFYSGAPSAVLFSLLGLQALQILLVVTSGSLPGGLIVSALLIAQAVSQTCAFLVTAQSPIKSTAFHLLSTLSGIFLFSAIAIVCSTQPSFAYAVSPALPAGSLAFWGFVIACVAGVVVTCKLFPKTYNNWRTVVSNAIWSVLYFALVSAKRFPKPFNLSEVYKDKQPEPIALRPYYVQHSEFLPASLIIPAAEKMEGNVTVFRQLLTRVKKIFALIAILDHFAPQSNVKTSIDNKKRMAVWDDGSSYWPSLFLKTLFGFSIPGKKLIPSCETAINNYKKGQLLAYLAESGVASPLLKAAPANHSGTLMLDFRHLECYQTKPDYQPYGGVAYFNINKVAKRLELVSLQAPHSDREVVADSNNPEFRQAEDLVLASMYFQVITGKHLAEIHMTYNLVEVSLHNAFDVNGQWNHPIRTLLYLHLFSHELAEEITTEHLTQKGGVFNQVFATDYDSLIEHLNDCYASFEYGSDEDFETRTQLLSLNNESNADRADLLPNACIKWELEYVKVWRKYAEKVVNEVYADDTAVAKDKYLQCFYENLLKILMNGLPKRYEGLATKAGLIRYLVDTIHHLVIRHQVYGTTGVSTAMDPRLNKTQVPRDMGTSSVDEWRSLACVALATGRARFTLLMDDFTYLLNGVDTQYQPAMKQAFDALQEDLKALEEKWNTDAQEKSFNTEYFRAVPSGLHTGPGY